MKAALTVAGASGVSSRLTKNAASPACEERPARRWLAYSMAGASRGPNGTRWVWNQPEVLSGSWVRPPVYKADARERDSRLLTTGRAFVR